MLFEKILSRYIFILLTSFCTTALAQSTNNQLLNKWNKSLSKKNYSSDTSNVILLNQLSEQYLYNNTDSALYFAKQALQLTRWQKYVKGEAMSLLNVSRNYYVIGDYILSLDAATKLMDISNKISYQQGKAGGYMIIGLIYLSENKNDAALNSFKKALDLFIQLKDGSKTGKAYFNIGICYDEMGKPEQAFPYLNKAIEMAKTVNDNNLISMALNRKGEANYHQKNYNPALSYYQQVIDSKFSSNWEVDFALSGLAQTYYKLGKYDKAILYAQKSLALSTKTASGDDKIRALKVLSESYAAVKDYKRAYNFQTLFKNTGDSIFNSEKNEQQNSIHLKQQQADNKRLENQIKIKEETIAFSKRLLFFRNLIAVCFAIFLIIIIWNNRQKTALNRMLKKQNEDIALQKEEISQQKEELHLLNHTKDQLFSVISHDLRSPFAAILQTMDAMQSGELSAVEQKEVLNGFYQQVNVVTIMVNNLLIWATSQQGGIKAEPVKLDAVEIVNEIVSISTYLAKSKRITLFHKCEGARYIKADLNHFKIIIQNLIGNAIKFTPHGGTIEIYCTDEETCLAIHIKDNGIGILPQKMDMLFKITGKEISGYGTNNEAGAGIGLALIKQFVDANNGKIDVQSKPGEGSEFIVYLERA